MDRGRRFGLDGRGLLDWLRETHRPDRNHMEGQAIRDDGRNLQAFDQMPIYLNGSRRHESQLQAGQARGGYLQIARPLYQLSQLLFLFCALRQQQSLRAQPTR
jgi:hypothetical protein